MRITDAVARSLCGDGITTGRDEKGLFIHYDRMEIELRAGLVQFWSGDLHVGTLTMSKALSVDDTISLNGVEGRMRLTIGGN